MAKKELVIDSAKGTNPGTVNQWTPLTNANEFIGGILTPPLTASTNIGALVSGIPSAFARVDLFHNAIKNGKEDQKTAGTKNLNTYYIELLNEWKGMIAALALDYASFEVRKIDLAYSDGKDISATSNLYEPKGAFGNMLLERRQRWRPVGRDVPEQTPPFINMIKYRGGVVGATSPETLVFTSSGYGIDTGRDNLPWVNNGRFTDPLNNSMSEDQVITLYAYVNYILGNLDKIGEYYKPLNDEFVEYTPHRTVLSHWLQKIGEYAAERRYDVNKGTVPPVSLDFSEPFKSVFFHRDRLYSVDGVITEQFREGAIEFDPKRLLLGRDARIARIHLPASFSSEPYRVSDLPVQILRATVKNQPDRYAYFALPLSAQGLDVFGRSIGSLVGNAAVGQATNHRLTAVYDEEAHGLQLSVELAISTESGKTRTFKEKYDVGNEEGLRNHDLLLWPNFISRQWNAYYLFSEMPHSQSTTTYSAYPFVGDPEDNFRIIKNSEGMPLALAERNKVVEGVELPGNRKLDVSLPVQSGTAVAENSYKYEIYRSNMPFKGIRLVSPTQAEGGYLLINYTQEPDRPTLPRDMLNSRRPLRKVTLGVDFGSTNTSLAYAESNSTPTGFTFGRQRLSLLGMDQPGGRGYNTVQPNQVLFFQSRERPLQSNAVKSILTLHSDQRLHPLYDNMTDSMRAAEAVTGGFPCFMENMPVQAVNEDTILLQYQRIGRVEQIHNMKWSDRELDKSHKTAYLRTLLLQVYAELFADEHCHVPDKLVWSYPSAFDRTLLLSYQQIWNQLGGTKVSPVTDEYGHPVELKISQYTLDCGLNTPNPFGPTGSGMPDNEPFGAIGSGGFGAFGSFGNDPFGQPANMAGNGCSEGQGDTASNGLPFGGSSPFGRSTPFGGNGTVGSGFGGCDVFGGASATGQSGSAERPDFKPDDPNRVTNYNAKLIFPDGNALNSLTEATAVANFTSETLGTQANRLYLCFDVGGSTTDISALWISADRVTMIKQNSIRFAARNVSQATSKIPAFEDVLRKVCAQTGVRMLGLNEGQSRYNSDTAPYYFEQIVDRLDNAQLRLLYNTIGADCKPLLCVNMFVTGLLMFYAGQLAHKLVDDLMHLPPNEQLKQRPYVTVTFAGKGSRLFQWLSIIPGQMDQRYYREMFVAGYGKEALQNTLGDWPKINLPDNNREKDVKYEVSKGLAKGNPKLYEPSDCTQQEIVGEENFEVIDAQGQSHLLADINTLTPEMIRYIGRYFSPIPNKPCGRFYNFCGLYYNALTHILGIRLNLSIFQRGFREMNVVQKVQSSTEFKAALLQAESGEPFDYVAPIIIIEGMTFYDGYLFPSMDL